MRPFRLESGATFDVLAEEDEGDEEVDRERYRAREEPVPKSWVHDLWDRTSRAVAPPPVPRQGVAAFGAA
jgi:hypothetical protein